ncbi:hypothetical protein HPB50_026890 [Hyalomma asiaticum]|uniref:Uncharacterized protein n=1 Tax=Hyalomma asiaticum TaxID=266040 RepID=A0ACB7S0C4_HYAAI|nr:hypothetical protein HPB50_026890 [Hyalomma asiaticum]
MSNRKVLKKVSAGFQVDMNTLFRKFTAEEIIRFAAFSKVWREMKFSLVFCGREERELRLFFEEIVPAVLQFWLPTSPFREKVFGLYMLYAVYALQPTFPRLKRSPVMYNSQNEDGEDVSAFAALTGKVYAPLDKMAKRGTLQVLTMVHRKYMAVKAEQAEPEVRDLDFVKEDIYEDIRRQISALQLKHGYRESRVAAGTSHKDEATSSDEEDDVAARRKALKAKSFRCVANTRKGRRLEQLMYDMAEGDPEYSASISPAEKRMRKQPPRAAKMAAEHTYHCL